MRCIAKALIVFALALLTAAPAQADFGVKDFSFGFNEEDGSPATQAGSHPYSATVSFDINTKEDPEAGVEMPDQDLKTLRISLPSGFGGNRTAVPTCDSADFLIVDEEGYPDCPDSTAVGFTRARILNASSIGLPEPVYNLQPPPGVAAKLGFIGFNVPITIEVGVDQDAPNDLVSGAVNVPQAVPVFGATVQLWGVPAAQSHDALRGRCLSHEVGPGNEEVSQGICPTDAEERAFVTLPRSCSGTIKASYEAISWQAPNAPPVRGGAEGPGMTGCSALDFTPQVRVKTSSGSAESASGFDFEMDVPSGGFTHKGELSQSDLKKAIVKLPVGMTVNPSSANGLAACSKVNYEAETLTSKVGEGCPEASKVGELEAESPSVEGEVITGSIFLASQDDNPFGSLVALYLVIRDPELGVLVKRALKVEPIETGPEAGRLITTVDDLPQVPISHARFHFKAGPRAPLVTPPTCGTYTTEAKFTPWAAPASTVERVATFSVDSGVNGGPCPSGAQPFHPGFSAGSVNNQAGAYSPFNVRLTRRDGEQEISRLDAVLPRGLTAKLAGVAMCPDSAVAAAKGKSGRAELANPSCPAASEIGRVLAGAGVGATLTYVPGKLYLGGPFAGAPLSLIAIAPIVVGPFDVGTTVVHAAIQVDPETAEIKIDGAHSEPLPRLLRGIPAKLRDLRVFTDRPNFALNPTSCAKKAAQATVFGNFLGLFNSADGTSVSLSDRYQAARCASLKFKPKLALSLKGGVKRGDHPAFKGVLTYPRGPGYSNIAKVEARLPHSAFLDTTHIRTICTRVQFAAKACPRGSIYGKARAVTPLLDEPLAGPVYLRSSSHPLPDLVVALHGIVDFDLVGRVDSVHGGLRARFESAPDAPVSKFTLEMRGGKKGLIVNSRNICARKSRATAALTAQNGTLLEQHPVIKASCGKAASKHKRG